LFLSFELKYGDFDSVYNNTKALEKLECNASNTDWRTYRLLIIDTDASTTGKGLQSLAYARIGSPG